jgi:hypothetical protein
MHDTCDSIHIRIKSVSLFTGIVSRGKNFFEGFVHALLVCKKIFFLVDEKNRIKVSACSFEITYTKFENPSSNPLQGPYRLQLRI